MSSDPQAAEDIGNKSGKILEEHVSSTHGNLVKSNQQTGAHVIGSKMNH